jgi:LysM domain
MALRQEELYPDPSGVVLRFPTGAVRARVRRQHVLRRLGLIATGIVVVAVLVLATGPGGSAIASRRGTPGAVVVAPGQTLWELAERYAQPTVDRRAYVDAIIDLNGIEGAVQAGEHLRLP